MRRTRWLILAAIIIILVVLASTYSAQLARLRREAPETPTPLKAGIEATAEGWRFRKTDDNRRGPNGEPCPVVEVHAKNFHQVKEPSSFELEGVDLKLFRECGKSFDEVKSAKASFDITTGDLYSEGQVEITMGVPPTEAPSGRLVTVISSGVRFETKTGKSFTDKEASFTFEQGNGKAVGADYDPTNRQLHMKSQVELNWEGGGPGSAPMRIETDDLVYHEALGVVTMEPWAKMSRGTMLLEGAKTYVTLEESVIRKVESENAKGVQNDPGRKVEYSAEHLLLEFSEKGEINKVIGDRNARLSSVSATGQTNVSSQRVELTLKTGGGDSMLERAFAQGQAVVESKPAVKPNTPPADTRILKSEMIELRMRQGGQEINNIETHAPGTLEFVPNRPGQAHRTLNGEKFWIAYAAENQIESFRSIKVTTRTDNPPRNGKPVPPIITSSAEFEADFDPKTNQVARLEQNVDFRYQEGDRKAQSDRAQLDEKTNLIALNGSARVWDPAGATSADRILLNQKSGEFTAEGRVTSTRLPDKKGQSSAMLSQSEAIQAKANRMVSTDDNQHIRYEGNAVAWQGANRIQADRIEIRRKDGVMSAAGSVVSQFQDKSAKPKDGKGLAASQPAFTIVKAPQLVYTEKERLAHYTGGAVLERPKMSVKAREIRAFLNDSEAENSLDRAYADGSVVVVQHRPGRTRTGTSEQAEYYAAEEKIILSGGDPQFVDSQRGTTKGERLTYFAGNDRLLVNGVEAKRAESTILRK